MPQLDNRPPEAPEAVVEATPTEPPTVVVKEPSRPNTSQRTASFNPLNPPFSLEAPKEQIQNQSVKTTQQAPQLKKPAYKGLPTNLLAPPAAGSFDEAVAAQARRDAEGVELQLFYNQDTDQYETRYVRPESFTGKTQTLNDEQRGDLSTIYDTIVAEQNKKYDKLIRGLPTMTDQMLEYLVLERESFPYEIRQMILDQYKTRINYHDRLRNPQNYPGEPSPLIPRTGE